MAFSGNSCRLWAWNWRGRRYGSLYGVGAYQSNNGRGPCHRNGFVAPDQEIRICHHRSRRLCEHYRVRFWQMSPPIAVRRYLPSRSQYIMAAIFVRFTAPITAPQILWVNMVTSVALGLVISFEPHEIDVMQRPPRAVDRPIPMHLDRGVSFCWAYAPRFYVVRIFLDEVQGLVR